MTTYIHDRSGWPEFRWDAGRIAPLLSAVRHRQGRLVGRMESLGFPLRSEAILQTLTLDVMKSSEIEGELLDLGQVRSSIARRLGLDIGGTVQADRDVDGVVEMMLDATQRFDRPLTKKRLFAWHASLFPTGRSGHRKIRTGAWRDDSDGPMQVVSGPAGRERIHFEAPSADRIPCEMTAFLEWYERDDGTDLVLKAAIAHFRFVTVHPFDDGNGRIGRAIADMALARSEGSRQRFYSLSARIRRERNGYYDALEAAQKGTLDITDSLTWFLACLDRAITDAEETLEAVLRKARFWEIHRDAEFNPRQRKMLGRLLDGIEGKMTSTKWAKMANCSQDTAFRDIIDLVDRGILSKDPAGGRSTSYSIVRI